MEDRYVIFEEWSGPKIFAIPISQTARLLNEHLDRKPRVFDSLAEAKQAALAIADRTAPSAKPRFGDFSNAAAREHEQLRRTILDLTEDAVERYIL